MKNKKIVVIIMSVITLLGLVIYLLSYKVEPFCEMAGGTWVTGPLNGGTPFYEYCDHSGKGEPPNV